jgi:hypothetical protein
MIPEITSGVGALAGRCPCRLPVGLSPLRHRDGAAFRAGRPAPDRVRQYRRDERPAHGQQDGGRADAHPRRREGRHRCPDRPRAGRRGCRTGGGPRGIFGHCFPVFLGFRGGKGVATFLGTLLALFWPAGVAACLTWLLVAAVTRYSSLSALVAAVLSPLWAAFLGRPEAVLLCVLLAALIFWRHGENIARLRAGTESKIGRKS